MLFYLSRVICQQARPVLLTRSAHPCLKIGILLFPLFLFSKLTILLFLFFAYIAGSSRFTKAVCVARKGKAVTTEATNPPVKRVFPSKDVIVVPHLSSQPLAEELLPSQPESLLSSASTFASAPMPPTDVVLLLPL